MKSFFFRTILVLSLLVPLSLPLIAEEGANDTKTQEKVIKKEKGIDWFETTIAGGYLIGIFILFPLVIFTNMKEGLEESNQESSSSNKSLEEREELSLKILEEVENHMTHFTTEEGDEMVTISSGKEAKFLKNSLDYITIDLKPESEDILARVGELAAVYEDRSERIFTGSYKIMACAVGILAFMWFVGGVPITFSIIQISAVIFYYLSSKTPKYILDKRIETFGSGKLGIVSGLLSGVLLGASVNHYVKEGSGPWKRDYESEFSSGMVMILIGFVIAMFIGFFISVFGVINFFLNYSTSFLNPLKKRDQWYNENFKKVDVATAE